MNLKIVFASVAMGAQMLSFANAQVLAPDTSLQTYTKLFGASNALGLGNELGEAALDNNVGKAAGALAAELIPMAVTKGGVPQQLLGLIAGDQIKFLTETLVNNVINRPDERSCLDKAMARTGIKFEDVQVSSVSERGPSGRMDYEIELRKQISEKLLQSAIVNNQSYIRGCIEAEQDNLQNELKQLKASEDESSDGALSSSCVVTESELFDYFVDSSGGSTAYANSSVIRISESPKTELLSNNPYTYRLHNMQLCDNLASQNLVSSGVDDSVYDSIKSIIISEIAEYCNAGSRLTGADKAFTLNENEILIVELAQFQCQWEFSNHPFCGARACEVREYKIEGSDSTLVKNYLQ